MKRRKCAARITQTVTETMVRDDVNHWNKCNDIGIQVIYRGQSRWTFHNPAFAVGMVACVQCGIDYPVPIRELQVVGTHSETDDDE